MQHSQLTQQVRELVCAELKPLGLTEAEPRETILIANGQYAGRRFEAASGYALWFLEEEQIKVFEAGGQLLRKLRVPRAPEREFLAKAA